jgi:tRNA nucleotidyltransferase (CCA-adding enzyme)
MKAYIVGGAVRDRLLGLPASDRDWVVVGSTPQQMAAAGFMPVGRDFPVFLHPDTHEEYALARTERKSARGYRGFTFHAAPDVTLEQDLARRDLTINAIALDPDSGRLIDPFGGQRDLEAGVLRHVSAAFAEDPVRLLRLARFAARWPGFTVAPATLALLKQLVDTGEVDALVAERAWQELSQGLVEAKPSRMFDLLRDCGALARLAPALDTWMHNDDARERLMQALDRAAAPVLPLRFACLCHGLDATGPAVAADLPATRALCERWRVDTECRELALLVAREWPRLHGTVGAFDAATCLALLDRSDAWRRPARVELALAAFAALGSVLPLPERTAVDQRCRLLRSALQAAQLVSTVTLDPAILQSADGPAIGRALRTARLRAVEAAFAQR